MCKRSNKQKLQGKTNTKTYTTNNTNNNENNNNKTQKHQRSTQPRDQIFPVILAGNGGIEPWLKGDIWGYERNS